MQQPIACPRDVFCRAVELVSQHTGFAPDVVRQPRRHVERRARATAVYLTAVSAGFGSRRLARAISVPAPTIHACLTRIENLRDDSAVDLTITRLEEAMQCTV